MHVMMRRRDPVRVLLCKGAKAGETEGGTSCRKETMFASDQAEFDGKKRSVGSWNRC